MPINPHNPFKGRQFPGAVIVLCVRWYLRYPLSYEHVAELVAERGVQVDASCIWRWVQAYSPELNKRCRPHLKPANKSYRIDETYINVKCVADVAGHRDSEHDPEGPSEMAGQKGCGGPSSLHGRAVPPRLLTHAHT